MKKLTLVLIMAALAGSAFADKTTETNNYYITEEIINESVTTVVNNSSKGAALGIATSQHHFDFGTKVWQGSVGVGYSNGNTATSFAIAKKFNRLLVNGSVGKEDGSDLSYGAGLNWRF